jgi:ubiquinone/menaquinone biosynthesis C-methylase UbiE
MTPVVLSPMLKNYLSQNNIKNMTIADVGCGRGVFLSRLLPYVKEKGTIVGVDLSRVKLARLREQFGLKVVASDAARLGLRKETFDLVISNQVIEHIPQDLEMLRELYRILKQNGHLYLSTVLKRWYAIYIYRREGRFTLSRNHLREYGHPKEVEDMIRNTGFIVRGVKITPFKWSLAEVLFHFLQFLKLVRVDLLEWKRRSKKVDRLLREIRVPVPGYYKLEYLLVKE